MRSAIHIPVVCKVGVFCDSSSCVHACPSRCVSSSLMSLLNQVICIFPKQLGKIFFFWGDKYELQKFQAVSSYPLNSDSSNDDFVSCVCFSKLLELFHLGFYMPVEVLCECTYTSSGIWTNLQILFHICESAQGFLK